ncbi:MAG: tRNA lysidine(34) synthetase TilS [Muribaculaceae bacterium]|nr:tRNA lysidine(34) synthetase TilS [Muribaculaceae bacterium]
MREFAIQPGEAPTFRDAVRKLRNYILTHDIRSVLLGLSGGADSVLALRLLAETAKDIPGFRLAAAHANFQLRAEESMRDENFVRELAFSMSDVEFFFERFDTLGYAREHKLSIEMAARELRHSWWDRLCREADIRLIATGHNADDNEETLLLNLLRGSSPRGLRGMSPLGDRIFRPLLGLSRKDILRLLEDAPDKSSPLFMTDSTNLHSDYRRNFLRNEILPQLRSRWEGLDSALQNSIELQEEASALTEYAVAEFIRNHNVDDLNEIAYKDIHLFPAPLTLIFSWLSPRGISTAKAREIADHIPDLNRSDNPTAGRHWTLDDGSRIVTTDSSLRLEPINSELCIANQSNGNVNDLHHATSEWKILAPSKEIFEKIRVASADEVYLPHPPSCYEWRRPKKGDRILLFPTKGGRRKSKLVSDVMREAAVPFARRQFINLLINKESGEIVWIPGIRRGGTDLIDEKCHKIFYLNLHK